MVYCNFLFYVYADLHMLRQCHRSFLSITIYDSNTDPLMSACHTSLLDRVTSALRRSISMESRSRGTYNGEDQVGNGNIADMLHVHSVYTEDREVVYNSCPPLLQRSPFFSSPSPLTTATQLRQTPSTTISQNEDLPGYLSPPHPRGQRQRSAFRQHPADRSHHRG